MIRIGCCGCMVDPKNDPVGIDVAEVCADLGYDYVELSLRDVAALQEADFRALGRRLEASGLRSEACNNFFPPERRITGPSVDFPALALYTEKALSRAKDIGAEVVVFGSSGARNVPEGFPMDRARDQIVEASKMIADTASRFDILVAIEYHNRGEANVLTSMEEAMALQKAVSAKHLRLLSDYYHFALEREPLSVIEKAGGDIVHLHFADPVRRRFPTEPKEEFRAFFRTLALVPYGGRLSIEAFTDDFRSDAERSLSVLRSIAV